MRYRKRSETMEVYDRMTAKLMITPLVGDLCGSVFLDLAFQSYICTLIGKEQYDRIKEKPKRQMIEQFEFGVKRCFTTKEQQQFSVELPGVQDDPNHDIIDDSIPIKA